MGTRTGRNQEKEDGTESRKGGRDGIKKRRLGANTKTRNPERESRMSLSASVHFSCSSVYTAYLQPFNHFHSTTPLHHYPKEARVVLSA